MNILSEPKIIYHHIPKCGGTSVVTSLALTYYPLRLLRHGRAGFEGTLNAKAASIAAAENNTDPLDFRRSLLQYYVEKDKTPLISGHYPYNHQLSEAQKKEWTFITLLRDPVERWYSEYYWNRHKDHEYKKTELSFEEYLKSNEGQFNAQTFLHYFSNPEAPSIESAVATLKSMDVVGFLENLTHYKSQMKSTFGRAPLSLQRNKSPARDIQEPRPDINSDFHRELLNDLAADIEIYQVMKAYLKA